MSPARSFSHAVDNAVVTLPRARPPVTFKPSVIRPIGELFVWLQAFAALRQSRRRVVGRDTVERRAVALPSCVQARRPDLCQARTAIIDARRHAALPIVELSKMLDQAAMPPTQQAVEIIERNLELTAGRIRVVRPRSDRIGIAGLRFS